MLNRSRAARVVSGTAWTVDNDPFYAARRRARMRAMPSRIPASIGAVLVLGLIGTVPAARGQEQEPRPNNVQVGVPRGSESDQQRDQEAQRRAAAEQQKRSSRPVPRDAQGHVVIGPTSTDKGLWLPGPVIPNPLGLTNTPYQPWTRAIVTARRKEPLEPHTRCKPSGVARQFLTPYGVEIVELPELSRAYIFDVGGPHMYRTV